MQRNEGTTSTNFPFSGSRSCRKRCAECVPWPRRPCAPHDGAPPRVPQRAARGTAGEAEAARSQAGGGLRRIHLRWIVLSRNHLHGIGLHERLLLLLLWLLHHGLRRGTFVQRRGRRGGIECCRQSARRRSCRSLSCWLQRLRSLRHSHRHRRWLRHCTWKWDAASGGRHVDVHDARVDERPAPAESVLVRVGAKEKVLCCACTSAVNDCAVGARRERRTVGGAADGKVDAVGAKFDPGASKFALTLQRVRLRAVHSVRHRDLQTLPTLDVRRWGRQSTPRGPGAEPSSVGSTSGTHGPASAASRTSGPPTAAAASPRLTPFRNAIDRTIGLS